MIHHFYGLGAVVPAARTALGEICEEVGAALKGNEAHAASA
jgi:hypothetical protein